MLEKYKLSNSRYSLINHVKTHTTRYTVLTMTTIALLITVIIILVIHLALSSRPPPKNNSPNVQLFDLPATLTPPGGENLKFVYLGYGTLFKIFISNEIGTQNYTCNSTSGTFITSANTAEAQLFDVTQFYTGVQLDTNIPPINDLKAVGSHFFVVDPLNSGSLSPKFQSGHNFVIGAKNASAASTVPTFSVASVLLQNIQPGKAGGSLADWVVRTNSVGGVIPQIINSCSGNEQIAIPYRADYLFFSK